MSQYLPYSEFKWLNKKEISRFCLSSIGKNSFAGYTLEKLTLNILMNYIIYTMIIH